MPNNINGATIREVDEDLEDMNSFYNRYPPKQDPQPLEVRGERRTEVDFK